MMNINECPKCGEPYQPQTFWDSGGSHTREGAVPPHVPDSSGCLRRQLAAKDAEIERLKNRLDALQRRRAENYIAECKTLQDENKNLRAVIEALVDKRIRVSIVRDWVQGQLRSTGWRCSAEGKGYGNSVDAALAGLEKLQKEI